MVLKGECMAQTRPIKNLAKIETNHWASEVLLYFKYISAF